MRIKRLLYFPVASYFRFFARIQLSRWHPVIIVVTGSTGKTTLLHLIASQLLKDSRYSHHANSSFGVQFDILGLSRKTLTYTEWFSLFLLAPLKAWKKPWKENLYVVETDCDRPGEGKFLATLLQPSVTLWVNVSRTHSMNFDKQVENKQFKSVEEAIAHEFGYFARSTRTLVVVNADSIPDEALKNVHAEIKHITKKSFLQSYSLEKQKTLFHLHNQTITLPFLLPEESFVSLCMLIELLSFLKRPLDSTFAALSLPPGRSSVFAGIHETTLIDSSYNASLEGMRAMLTLLHRYPAQTKWAVLGDMIEQGKEEKEEHEKLATIISRTAIDRVIFVGPRVIRYTYPLLKQIHPAQQMVAFEKPDEALRYLRSSLPQKAAVLFKGARFLEGVIAHLLVHADDVTKLCRREKIWQIRRKQWGL